MVIGQSLSENSVYVILPVFQGQSDAQWIVPCVKHMGHYKELHSDKEPPTTVGQWEVWITKANNTL